MSDTRDRDDEYRNRNRSKRTAGVNPTEQGKWVSVLVALLGLWMLVEAFIFDVALANFWNDVIVGVALLVLGGYNYSRRADERFGSVAVGVLVAVIGLWLILAPFVLTVDRAPDTGMLFWNDVVVGAVTLLAGIYSAYMARRGARAAAPA